MAAPVWRCICEFSTAIHGSAAIEQHQLLETVSPWGFFPTSWTYHSQVWQTFETSLRQSGQEVPGLRRGFSVSMLVLRRDDHVDVGQCQVDAAERERHVGAAERVGVTGIAEIDGGAALGACRESRTAASGEAGGGADDDV